MKYKLLSVWENEVCNIGDYIQALAASQFLPSLDGFINRETVSEYDGEECKVIMNGWFMHHPEKWPPSKKIIPLFVAFHMNKSVTNTLLLENNLLYFREHEPIGCRDRFTCDLLKEKGIQAYFSGCLTLTLGDKYHSNQKDEVCYFVDPIIPRQVTPQKLLKDLFTLICNYNCVKTIAKKGKFSKTKSKNYLLSARFYRLYSKVFTHETLKQAEYICQESSYYTKTFMDDTSRLDEAKRLVTLYSKARFVVTSRIHCALPCLGLKTPVYFLQNTNDNEISSCRFDGLIELFNTIQCSSEKLLPLFQIDERLSLNNVINNKESWVQIAKKLSSICNEFVGMN